MEVDDFVSFSDDSHDCGRCQHGELVLLGADTNTKGAGESSLQFEAVSVFVCFICRFTISVGARNITNSVVPGEENTTASPNWIAVSLPFRSSCILGCIGAPELAVCEQVSLIWIRMSELLTLW